MAAGGQSRSISMSMSRQKQAYSPAEAMKIPVATTAMLAIFGHVKVSAPNMQPITKTETGARAYRSNNIVDTLTSKSDMCVRVCVCVCVCV